MRRYVMAVFLFLLVSSIGFSTDWQITELDNGLKVMILENHQVPQVNISTAIQVGAKNESDYFDGATHLLEHLILFRGTEKLTGEELGEEMTKHGAYFNGYTSSDWTDFVISLPKENLEFALKIHSDMLFRSNFPAEEMDKERQAVLEEISISKDDPYSNAYHASLKELFGTHPYSKDVLGPREIVASIPRDSVYAYYKRYYAPNNMSMAIVGDLDATQTLELVKKYFGDIPRGDNVVDNYSPPPKHDKVIDINLEQDIDQAYLMMSTIGPKANSSDQFAIDIIATILANGESSRFWKKLKEELGLVYSTSFNFYTNKYEGIMFSFATLDKANIEPVENAINDILNEVKTNGFTEHELRKAKNQIKTNFYISQERGLNLADNYAQYDSFIGYQFIRDYPDNIEKVSLAKLNEAAVKYLNTDSYVKTTVVPR